MNELRIKPKLIVHVLIAVVVILLMLVTCWGLYFREDAHDPGVPGAVIAMVIFAIGSLILLFIARILITRPDVLYMNEEGFVYNPGGISSGFISWKEVEEIKLVEVNTTQGNLPGPVLETAIGVKLKNPGTYTHFSSKLLRPLLQLNKQLYDADLFIRISDLGEHRQKAMELLQQFGNHNQPLV